MSEVHGAETEVAGLIRVQQERRHEKPNQASEFQLLGSAPLSRRYA
jgi:hypothetical protein